MVFLRLPEAKGSGSLNFTYFGATVPFDPRKDWEKVIGVRPPIAPRNTNPNVVEYKGLFGAITSGATTTICGVGHKLR